MSKTQEKRKTRNIERLNFLLARRRTQLSMFEQAVAMGLALYEENKDKFSEEEAKTLEKLRQENEGLLEQALAEIAKLEAELDSLNQIP